MKLRRPTVTEAQRKVRSLPACVELQKRREATGQLDFVEALPPPYGAFAITPHTREIIMEFGPYETHEEFSTKVEEMADMVHAKEIERGAVCAVPNCSCKEGSK